MKNTTKRIWSILLAACMLVGLLSMAALADETGPVILTQPETAWPDEEGKYTFTVEAEGEGLTYQWYYTNSFAEDELIDHAMDSYASGYDTAELTAWDFDCDTSDTEFYCVITDASGNTATSESAGIWYEHAANELRYIFDEETHAQQCENCNELVNEMEDHDWADDGVTCTVCGYNGTQDSAPVFPYGDADYSYAEYGDDVEFTANAYGTNLKYEWQRYDEEADSYVTLPECTDATLAMDNVTCALNGTYYRCRVYNDAGAKYYYADLYVDHVSDGEYKKTSFGHNSVCLCGEELDTEAHGDADNDRVCDECGYAFAAGAPIITAQPKEITTKNGEDIVYTVTASGTGLEYQWYYDGDPIDADNSYFDGVNTATLTVYSVTEIDEGDTDCSYNGDEFYCVVSNAQGAVRTVTVVQNVEHETPAEWGGNDYFHWYDCACGTTIEGAHKDVDNNGKCDACAADFTVPFKDLTDPEEWYYEAAIYNYAEGIFTGEYGNFLAKDDITRGEVATVLARIAFGEDWIKDHTEEELEAMLDEYGVEAPKTVSDTAGRFYEEHVELLCAIGVIEGYENGTFRGENSISRQELALMLQRFAKLIFGEDIENITYGPAVEEFKDADEIADWAADEVEWCRAAGIFRGDENANFNPEDNANRAEVAQTLMRMQCWSGLLIAY